MMRYQRFVSLLLFSLFSVFLLLQSSDGFLSAHRRVPTNRDKSTIQARRRRPSPYYDDSPDEAYEDEYDDRDWNNGYSYQQQEQTQRRRPYWEQAPPSTSNAPLDPDYIESLKQDVPEWEQCDTSEGTVWVLLPPLSVDCPKSVLHFCGGYLTGSHPEVWYRDLLEDICIHTNVAIVCSRIPVNLIRNPLQHLRLAQILRQQFVQAYQGVLVDEYGQSTLKHVPVCGVGHSLGSRLLVILATLRERYDPTLPPPYKNFVVMSFTNFPARAGIPGVSTLLQAAQRQKREPRRRRHSRVREDDLEQFVQDVTQSWQKGTSTVQQWLTPTAHSLEFYPTPDELWDALEDRYTIPETLLIQMDDDVFDQSAALANALVDSNATAWFCRVRGSHLLPVRVSSDASENSGIWKTLHTKVGQLLLLLASSSTEEQFVNLRQSIVRYINEKVVVTRTVASESAESSTPSPS